MVAVTFTHRSSQQWTRFADAASDVDDLLRYIRDNAATLDIDADLLAIWVCSAGGPVGLHAALADAPSAVRCIVAYYAIMDAELSSELAAQGITAEMLRPYSAIALLQARGRPIPPLLIARAGKDNPRLNATIDRFIEEALAKNVALDVMNHPDGQHAFDVLDDDPRSHEIIQRTLAFLRRHLLGGDASLTPGP